MSGITTTGATVIINLDSTPKKYFIMESDNAMVRGIGIIVMAITILLLLKGGMRL